jgi:hypothetical protein
VRLEDLEEHHNGDRDQDRPGGEHPEGVDRVHVVGVAVGPHRQRHDLAHLAALPELLALGDQLLHGRGGGRHQVGVAEQDHVLDRVRDAVDLAVEGHALDGQLVVRRARMMPT